MNIHASGQPKEEAGAHLSNLLNDNAGNPVLLMISGGSALEVLSFMDLTLEAMDQLSIALIDERFSFNEDELNTDSLIKAEFYKTLHEHGVDLIDPRATRDDTPESAALHYEEALHGWKAVHPHGKIIALLGMGADGHTAGILPMPQNPKKFTELFEGKSWIVGYHHDNTTNPFHERITVTLSFLEEQVDHAVVYAIGEDKCSTLETVLNGESGYGEMPASVLTAMQQVELYTDCEV